MLYTIFNKKDLSPEDGDLYVQGVMLGTILLFAQSMTILILINLMISNKHTLLIINIGSMICCLIGLVYRVYGFDILPEDVAGIVMVVCASIVTVPF